MFGEEMQAIHEEKTLLKIHFMDLMNLIKDVELIATSTITNL
jgi:hypothetical protein